MSTQGKSSNDKTNKAMDVINRYSGSLKYGLDELKKLVEGKTAVAKVKYPTLEARDKEIDRLKELVKELNKAGFETVLTVKGNIAKVEHRYQKQKLVAHQVLESEELLPPEPEVKEQAYYGNTYLFVHHYLEENRSAPVVKVYGSPEKTFNIIQKILLDPLKEYVDSPNEYFKIVKTHLKQILEADSEDDIKRLCNSIVMNAELRHHERMVRMVKEAMLNDVVDTLKTKGYSTDDIVRIAKFIDEQIVEPLISSENMNEIEFLGILSAHVVKWSTLGPDKLFDILKRLAKLARENRYSVEVFEKLK